MPRQDEEDEEVGRVTAANPSTPDEDTDTEDVEAKQEEATAKAGCCCFSPALATGDAQDEETAAVDRSEAAATRRRPHMRRRGARAASPLANHNYKMRKQKGKQKD